jgi:hypothetical protein
VIWWRDTPDGRELKFALKGSEWLVLVEGDEREYRGGDLRVVLADALGASASDWLRWPIRWRLTLLRSKSENGASFGRSLPASLACGR